jgi:hypothetical protein
MNQERKRTWLIVGGAPGITGALIAAAMAENPTVIIATNLGGCYGGPRPTYYLLADPVASRRFRAVAEVMRDSGTRLVTLYRDPRSLAEARVEDFDIFLRTARLPWARYIPGCYVHVGFSGLYCLQFALNNGAQRVVLLGCPGYTAADDVGHGVVHGLDSSAATREIIGPFTQSAIAECGEVEFVIVGKPNYPVKGRNVRIIEVTENTEETKPGA